MSETERKTVVRESYRHFSRAMADLYWSPRLTAESLPEIFEFDGLEQLKEQCGTNRIIFACLHYGGFEWIPRALSLRGFDCTVVTQTFKNPLLDPIITALREGRGHQTVAREGALLRLFKALRAGRNGALAVDLTISARWPSVPITCLGMLKSVTFAHAWLHKRLGAPIVPTHCEPLAGGRYRIVLQAPLQIDPAATHQQIAQACWDRFEPIIRRQPAPWLWMYKHWRYRPHGTTQPYPDYANDSPHFRDLLTAGVKGNGAAHAPSPSVAG